MKNIKNIALVTTSSIALITAYLSGIKADIAMRCDDINIQQITGENDSQITIITNTPININRGEKNKLTNNITSSITHTYKTKGIKRITISKQGQKICDKTIEVKNIKGCIDKYASNYNPDANIDNKKCIYNFSPLTECSLIDFKSEKKSYLKNELVKFQREIDNDIQNIRIALDDEKIISDPQNPFGYRYEKSGKKEPKLLITTKDGLTTVCKTNFLVGKLGCTYEIADNFDPTAEINDGSCIIETDDPILNIKTKNPYKPGDRNITIRVQYNGNHQRIKTNAILSKDKKIVRKIQGELNKDGTIKIPINYQKNKPGYLEPGQYTLALQVSHYKNNLKEQIVYDINIGPIKKVNKPECGNRKLENGEECDSTNFCENCSVTNISKKQKELIEKIVKNFMQEKKLYTIDTKTKDLIKKEIEKQTPQNEILLYTTNYFFHTLSGIQ